MPEEEVRDLKRRKGVLLEWRRRPCVDEMWVTSRVESSHRLILGEETGTSDLQPQELNFARIKKEPGSRYFPPESPDGNWNPS